MQISMFLSEGPLVSPSASPGFEEALLTRGVTSCSHILPSLNDIAPNGWYGRTSPASCQATEDGILVPCSGGWQNSGMGSPTECLTLNTSEFHSAAAVSLLSDILETGDVPPPYFLSARACSGILRRAERRGKQLPTTLRHALEQVVSGQNA